MKIYHYLFLACILLYFNRCTLPKTGDSHNMVCERLAFVESIYKNAAVKAWPQLADSVDIVPLVYFKDDTGYINHATERMVELTGATLFECHKDLKLYKYIDPGFLGTFKLITKLDFTDTCLLHYNLPVTYCNSPENAHLSIPAISSTEEWAARVIHEYFHAYQLLHQGTRYIYRQQIAHKMTVDSLNANYIVVDWFKQGIDKENALLLKALEVPTRDSVIICLQAFVQAREQRRDVFEMTYHYNIDLYEDYFEKMEGTARYMEFQVMKNYGNLVVSPTLAAVDTFFHAFKDFKRFNLEKFPWLYKTQRAYRYVYATGMNQARLLDKLQVPYKEDLFDTSISLYAILHQWLEQQERKMKENQGSN